MFCQLETTKRTYTLLRLLEGIVPVKFLVLHVKFIEESVKQQAHYFLGLARLDTQLDSI